MVKTCSIPFQNESSVSLIFFFFLVQRTGENQREKNNSGLLKSKFDFILQLKLPRLFFCFRHRNNYIIKSKLLLSLLGWLVFSISDCFV